jgi:PII-like signaling protein
MILDQDSSHGPDTRRREGVGGAIFFRKIEGMGKERDSEGKGMSRVLPTFGWIVQG